MHKVNCTICFCLCMVFFSQTAYTQNNRFAGETYVGINGGVTASKIYFRPDIPQDILTGYQGGLVFRYISEKNLGVQAELNYVQRGWNESNGIYAKQLDYVDLPFLTHLYFGDRMRFFVNLGPKVGYIIRELELMQTDPQSNAEQHQAISNKFDYGFAGGLGISFHTGNQVIELDTRANFSVSTIFSNQRSDYFDYSNNMYASVSLTWLFRVK